MKRPAPPPPLDRLTQNLEPSALAAALEQSQPVDSQGRYLHWDDLRHRPPPDGLSLEQWWLGMSFARRALARDVPLIDRGGRPFRFSNVDRVQELVHRIDQETSGHILIDEAVTSPQARDRYLVSSLIEDAITSSQLEGASTTRRVAKQMLESGRTPRDRDERMILNNYRALQQVDRWVLERADFTAERILDLHRIVTEETLDDPLDAGRLQTPDEERVAVLWSDQRVLHAPPAAATLPDRLEALCAFANDGPPDGFIHPVVQAILVHFALGYDHPFVDGNGRTARALFYWSMLRSGYWLSQFLVISSILRLEPAAYSRAYMLVDTDDNDLTYFVLYQLDVLMRAIERLKDYLSRKMQEARDVERLLQGAHGLNQRQIAMIGDALREPTIAFTIAREQRRHRVSYPTARGDLLNLEERGLFTKQRIHRTFVFRPAPDLAERLSMKSEA